MCGPNNCGDDKNFERMAPRIRAFRCDEIPPPDLLISAPDRNYKIYYLPFEHVNRAARIALVGITPGPDQLESAYAKCAVLLQKGLPREEILEQIKVAAGFAGQMRAQLIKMLDYLDLPKRLNIERSDSLWRENSFLVHSTSILRNATFKRDKRFNGPFAEILSSQVLLDCFLSGFARELKGLDETAFIALGPTPRDALRWCAEAKQGYIQRKQILGCFPHPSGSNRGDVAYFLEKKRLDQLHPRDPTRLRAKRLDADREELKINLAELFSQTD
jgi:hypothetical protein